MVTVRDRLQTDLRAALVARDRPTIESLRIALALLANAEAVAVEVDTRETEVARRDLSDDEARSLLRREADELAASAATLVDNGRADRAEELTTRAAVLRRYA